jgi:PLP dependent protein
MSEEAEKESFAERLARVEDRIAAACAAAGRPRGEVRLLPVSKGHPPEAIRAAMAAGLTLFGENKVQEARAKVAELPDSLHWHLIGHLQTNKVKYAVRLFEAIHSVDSLKLLDALDAGAKAAGVTLQVFLEVNVSGEAAKFGLAPEEVPAVLEAATQRLNLEVVGLMTMPPFTEDPEQARPHFERLVALRDTWRAQSGFALDELSMGMSHDLEVAIDCGATWVRVGTDLFGARQR